MADQYIDKNEFKARLGLSGTAQDDNIDRAIDASSRLIDSYCQRRFFQDSVVTIKYFNPISTVFLDVPDLSTTTGLIVQLDTTDDGSYDTTLTLNTDFDLRPINPRINKITDGVTYYHPYTELRILETRSSERFEPLVNKNVKITAKWGWTKIPDAIVEATVIQATRIWKRKDTPFNVFGNESTGTVELFSKFDPDALELIKGYRRLNLSGQVL